MRTIWNSCYVQFSPLFHYVRNDFLSFRCVRTRILWNDCYVPLYLPFHYVRSVIYRSIVSASNIMGRPLCPVMSVLKWNRFLPQYSVTYTYKLISTHSLWDNNNNNNIQPNPEIMLSRIPLGMHYESMFREIRPVCSISQMNNHKSSIRNNASH